MLKLFEVENFKNFKDKIIIDFADTREYKFNTQCIKDGMLKNIIIYGKNSVGKTNLGYALFDITTHLGYKNRDHIQYHNYINCESEEKYASFKYVFDFDGTIVEYIYKKTDVDSFIYEELNIDGKLVFSYDFENKELKKGALNDINAETLNWEFVENDMSIVRYIANNTKMSEDSPLRKLVLFVSNMLWFRSLQYNSYLGYKKINVNVVEQIIKNGWVNDFERFLNETAGINKKLKVIKDPAGTDILYFDFKRPVPFLEVMSSGTAALTIFYYWSKQFNDISLLFIDEFDAFYHYELSEKVVKILQENNNFQTILTSHNTNLLTNKIMRPDCYFILTEHRLTSLINATRRELREGHNLEKLYMSGEFNE